MKGFYQVVCSKLHSEQVRGFAIISVVAHRHYGGWAAFRLPLRLQLRD
jgi:hypothetical protein